MASAPQNSPSPLNALGSAAKRPFLVVLTGNPNCGKTTLFNSLTGLRAKVGNYAGVTVERKEGRMKGSPSNSPVLVLDLPGTYSLSSQSLDEQIARDVLLHRLDEVAEPDLVVVIVDAANLERNLYFTTQVIELGYPTFVALNMMDVCDGLGLTVDAALLAERLLRPVFPMVASTGEGVEALRRAILQQASEPRRPSPGTVPSLTLPAALEGEVSQLAALLCESAADRSVHRARVEAVLLVSEDKTATSSGHRYSAAVRPQVAAARERLTAAGIDWRSAAIEARYSQLADIHADVVSHSGTDEQTMSDKLDRVLTHKVWGLLIFVAIMAVMFQSIFTLARVPMDAISVAVAWVGQSVAGAMPPGDLQSLLVDGAIAGVGAVVVFLPQICLLFLFIGLLEDTGYMSRAAFLMDRLMSRVGLHGKSFIPLLSSFACAIPGIMATRTIENPKDRLATILVAPLMSCSARLPVYTVLIAACIPDRAFLGVLRLPGLVLLGMYLLGLVVALFMAWLFKKTLLRGEPPLLIMELPPYKRPVVKVVARHMWDRSRLFLRRAGTVILGISIVLWFLATYPRDPAAERVVREERARIESREYPGISDAGALTARRARELATLEQHAASERLRRSFAGHIGRALEPVIAPLGYDWKIGIGIVASFAAREVFVSTLSTVYNVGTYDKSTEGVRNIAANLRSQLRPDGTPLYTPLTGISLMVFYVFALQCVSTVAVVRRETNGWKWTLFQWAYMGVLAWVFAFAVYAGGRALGW